MLKRRPKDKSKDAARAKRARKRRTLAAIILFLTAAAAIPTLKATVADVVTMPNASLAPEIPQGARALVLRNAQPARGDIVAFHRARETWLARVDDVSPDAMTLYVKNNTTSEPLLVHADDLIGKVVFSTR